MWISFVEGKLGRKPILTFKKIKYVEICGKLFISKRKIVERKKRTSGKYESWEFYLFLTSIYSISQNYFSRPHKLGSFNISIMFK